MGEPREAMRVGEGIAEDALPSGLVGRRTAIMVDMARAYGQVKMDTAAVNMRIEAERLSVQLRPFAERLGLLD